MKAMEQRIPMQRRGKPDKSFLEGNLYSAIIAAMMHRTSLIVWSLVWAIAFIATAYFFKGNPVKDWIEAALTIGALAFLMRRPWRDTLCAR